MNPYKFFHLIIISQNRQRRSLGNDGFVMPMVIMVGLVLTVIGIVILQRSMFQQNDSTNKAATSQAQNAAEAGVARITNLLNEPQRRFLATLPACRDLPLRTAGQTCSDVSTGTGTVVPNWQNLTETQIRNWSGSDIACKLIDDALLTDVRAISNSSDWQTLPQGQFRLVGYRYTDANGAILPPGNVPLPNGGVGVLTVEGSINPGQPNEAVSRVEVKIPVRPGPPEAFGIPGLWVTHTSGGNVAGNNTIAGDVLVNDCSGNLAGVSFPTGSTYTAKYTNADMPALPPAPSSCNNLGSVNANLTIPRRDASNVYTDTRTNITLNNGNTLPAYVYCVTSISLGGGKEMRVETLDTRPTIGGVTNPNRGQRFMVIFHLTGNLDLGGNGKIVHECPIPYEATGAKTPCSNYVITDFNIYGRAPLPANLSNLPKICLAGGSFMDAFILGPNYEYGVSGSGGNGGVRGTVMVRQVSNSGGCGSNTSNTVITQTGTWDDMVAGIQPQATAPTLGAFTGWSNRPTNEY
ncbi:MULTISPECIES: hypothetical protein [unclassified Synechocystis]|uniref:pilus assembly PilX family protein n=1 Tax=unclassified Synechocystis TaxID=2640012 RepID=UPI0003FEF898|nr:MULTISPECIES: hypothetical protein [unclassified Synechocystis]AIE73048.1 hypothetical protein D082_05190 [Synechocystis sp. PCC 6714]MCT0254418.1 hypothetical protein [Synechocystis sp. CS-94]